MRIVLTGAGGIVGGAVARVLAGAGHAITPLGRATGWQLGQDADLAGHAALIHCAFAHAPGRYRGGEGDDPAGFLAANLDGTRRLFDAAWRDRVGRVVFLSSRAVHDGHAPGLTLTDALPPAPTTLYGRVKAEAEAHLAALPLCGTSLRATGVYGPGAANKWRGLFADFRAGRPIAPRIATEVHADDLAHALRLLLDLPAPPVTANCSDLVLDRHDLLAAVAERTGCRHPLPARADRAALRVPDCAALCAAGWQPRGWPGLRLALPALLSDRAPAAGA